ncbi:uncharacterized protein LOC113310164 [Papaver somniferum]|uniref:uncharacterized protein LOC113310164 n=1 Tax=Papaver somniferum TaxID=3469 RepID=UPI000E6F8AE2|nr:uncharacterized protein LOC113310164 [Papaver somniferum]XP_026414528.1 uncharacterized protein LOC113310164 [Papaver somniferum]
MSPYLLIAPENLLAPMITCFAQMEAAKIAYMRNCWLARKEPHPCDVFKAKLLKNLKGHASTVRTESKKVLNCFLLRTKEASSGAAKVQRKHFETVEELRRKLLLKDENKSDEQAEKSKEKNTENKKKG